MNKLDMLNRASTEVAATMLTPVIERAPEVAARVAEHRPFANVAALCQEIRQALLSLDHPQRIELFNSHPELAPDNPLTMTQESQTEQGRLGLTDTGSAYRAKLDNMNQRYQEKFGFPFITALIQHVDMDSVITEFETRLEASRSDEIETALEQVATVSASRVNALFGSSEVTEEQ